MRVDDVRDRQPLVGSALDECVRRVRRVDQHALSSLAVAEKVPEVPVAASTKLFEDELHAVTFSRVHGELLPLGNAHDGGRTTCSALTSLHQTPNGARPLGECASPAHCRRNIKPVCLLVFGKCLVYDHEEEDLRV